MTNYALSPGSGVTSPEGGRVSLNGSYTSDPGYNSANNTSSNHYSDHEGKSLMFNDIDNLHTLRGLKFPNPMEKCVLPNSF